MSRVLVACEFSGIVRDAFIAAGHDAVSCDLLPSERPGPHYQGDIWEMLTRLSEAPFFRGIDLLIAHPPCTYLANSGVRWLYGGKGTERDPVRWAQMEAAALFFRALLNAPIPRVMVENPIMHGHAGIRKPDQIIQPWQFGHPETKATGLWLRNLPPLVPTDIVPGREPRVHHASPGPDRWKERSRTLPGIAAAMATQWGALLASDGVRPAGSRASRPGSEYRRAVEPRWNAAVSILIYLAAIVAANLSVATFGPSVTIINAFWLIGLDLTVRDGLHERWQDDGLRWKMSLLIAVGGAISWLLNRDAGQIALASTVAFVISAGLDAAVFGLLAGKPRMVRVNGSNLVGAAADSLIFPTLAFGSLLPAIVLGQFAAKVAGGFLWSVILALPVRRRAA